jgi:hypothetical protein
MVLEPVTMKTMILKEVVTVALIALAVTSIPLEYNKTRYVIVAQMIIQGNGVVDKDVFARAFRIAPDIPGWQELKNATLLINSRTTAFSMVKDEDGNKFAYPGPLSFAGKVNITLVQTVEVIRPPFRKVAEMPSDVEGYPANITELSKSQFWACKAQNANFTSLLSIGREIKAASTNIREYVSRSADWVYRNIKYTANTLGGVQCPGVTLSRREGACADIHALLTALLRIGGVDAYLAYAYVFIPERNITQNIDKWTYTLYAVEPHVFTMINSSGYVFPIDLTANTAPVFPDFTRGSAVNQLDNIIVMGWIKKSTPDTFLAIFAPNGASRVSYTVKIREDTQGPPSMWLVVIAILVSAALIIHKEKST